jgi:glycosyltransferase involved in cell wall biosynthesis
VTLFINARFLTQPMSGVQRYAHEILGALDDLLARDHVALAALGGVTALYPASHDGPLPDWRAIGLRPVPGGRGHAWEQGPLWWASRGGILIGLGNSGPLAHQAHVLALHDANLWEMPLAFDRRYRMMHRILRPLLARRALALLTVSHHAAGQLARHLNVDAVAFNIIPNSAAHIRRVAPDTTVLRANGLQHGRYILAVGNQSPNKNIPALIAAHAAAPDLPPLAIVGGFVPGVARLAPTDADRVIALGRVSEGELRALYEGACAMVFPSLHEGFGIPPLEAMELGLPVLAARRAALPEVLGNAALWCDPTSICDITRGLRTLAALTQGQRAEMIARGHARATNMTWEKSAACLLDLVLRLNTGPISSPSDASRSTPCEKSAPGPSSAT